MTPETLEPLNREQMAWRAAQDFLRRRTTFHVCLRGRGACRGDKAKREQRKRGHRMSECVHELLLLGIRADLALLCAQEGKRVTEDLTKEPGISNNQA